MSNRKKEGLLHRSIFEWYAGRENIRIVEHADKFRCCVFRKICRKKRVQIILVSLLFGFVSSIAFGDVPGYEKVAYKNKIEALMAMHQNKKALIEALQFYKISSENYDSSILLSRVLIANNDVSEAIIILKKLALNFPNNKEIKGLLTRYIEIDEVDKLKAMFDEGKYAEAIIYGTPLYEGKIDTYRAGLIIAQADFRLGNIDKAEVVYNQLIKLYPSDNVLKSDLLHLEALQAFKQANALIDKKNYTAALKLLKPYYYEGSPDEKTSGYLIAKVYFSEGKNKQGLDIYKKLVKKYPSDTGLSIEYMNRLLAAYHNNYALNYYYSIPEVERSAISKSVGNQLAKYYTNYVMMYGGAARSTRNYPVDNQVGIAVNKTFEDGAMNLSISRSARFNEVATQIDGIYYFSLKDGYSAFLGGSFSPENSFLAHYSFTAGLSKSIQNIDYYSSIRQLQYTAFSATVLSGGLRYYFHNPVSLGLTLYYIPRTTAYSIMISPEWNINNVDKLYGNFSWGMAGENLGVNLGILNTPSANVQIGDSYRIGPHFSVGAEVFFEYRKALYNRTGGIGYLRYWW